jgi:hypothetical protein
VSLPHLLDCFRRNIRSEFVVNSRRSTLGSDLGVIRTLCNILESARRSTMLSPSFAVLNRHDEAVEHDEQNVDSIIQWWWSKDGSDGRGLGHVASAKVPTRILILETHPPPSLAVGRLHPPWLHRPPTPHVTPLYSSPVQSTLLLLSSAQVSRRALTRSKSTRCERS